MDDIVLRNDGAPFNSFSDASQRRDVLNQETGQAHVVVEQDQGFGVKRVVHDAGPGDGSFAPAGIASEDIVVHPALRAYWFHMLILVLCAWMVFNPESLLTPIVPDIFLNDVLRLISGTLVLEWIGLVIGFYIFLRIVAGRYSKKYTIGREGVRAQNGIFRRETVSLQYRHIRSVGLNQTYIGRLFKVGDVAITSAGTSGVDLLIDDVHRPLWVQQEIEHRMHQGSGR